MPVSSLKRLETGVIFLLFCLVFLQRRTNIAISNRAKAKAFDALKFVFGALMVSFALMGIGLINHLLDGRFFYQAAGGEFKNAVMI